jgi:O-antigen ligase
VLGPFLVPAALIVLEELLRPRLLRAPRTVKTAMFLILVLGVLFAYSRAAWLNLLAATLTMLVVLALRRGGSRKAMAVLVTLLVAGAAVLGTVAVTGSMGFLEERAQLQSYDVDRFGAQRTGLELGEQHPIGVGPGQFELFAPISSHNTFVRSLAEQGVLGLFTILALVITTLIFAARNAVLGRDTYGIGSAALLGAWVGVIVNSLFIDSLHWRHLWFVAALIWVGTRRPAAGEVRE